MADPLPNDTPPQDQQVPVTMDRNQILAYFRQKDPRFVQVPDEQLASYIRSKYQDFASALPPQSVSQRAQANLSPTSPGNIRSDQAIASAGQDQANHYGRAAAAVVGAIPFALAAPIGATGLAAYGLMAAAGLTGGLAANEAKRAFGSNETLKGAALLNSLGIDTAVGVLSQGTGEATNSITTGLMPRMVENAAAKATTGAKALDDIGMSVRTKLSNEIAQQSTIQGAPPIIGATKAVVPSAGGPALATVNAPGSTWVDVGPQLNKAFDLVKNFPKGVDALGAGYNGRTPGGQEIQKMIEDTIQANAGSNNLMLQPLDGLITLRAGLNSAVRAGGKSLSLVERKAYGDLSDGLAKTITSELGNISPESVQLYQRFNELGAIKDNAKTTLNLAGKVVSRMVRTGIGSSVGYLAAGPVGGGVGALIGGGLDEVVPKVAAFAVQRAAQHPESASAMKAAIKFITLGKDAPAETMMGRAFVMAGVRDAVKTWINDNVGTGQPQSSPENP